MTSSDNRITYASFCGTLLDDMLDQVIHNIISRSLLDEKLIRKNYGSIGKPIFHDSPYLNEKENDRDTLNNNTNVDKNMSAKSNSNDSDEDDDSSDNNNNRIDLTSEDDTKVLKSATKFLEPDIGRFQFTLNGKDVYVNALNDNRNLLGAKANAIVVGSAQDTYFKCSNCDRKIAGSRFGAHIDKCLGGRSRK